MRKIKFILIVVFSLMANVVICQTDSIQKQINYYISQAKLDSAKTYIQTNLDKLPLNKNKSQLNYQLVKVLFIQSSYDEALKQAFNSIDKIDDQKLRVKFNFMIGCIYSAITDYKKSIEYFDLVVKHSDDASLSVQTHLLLSQLHLELDNSENAEKSITEAYKITERSNIDSKTKNHVAMQYNFFSKNYELCKQQNFSIIKDTTSFLNAKSYAYAMIGDCLIKQDSLQEATTYFDEFLKLTVETKDPEQIKVAANKLIDVYEKMGNQEKANAYHKIYNEAVNDSLSFSVEKYRDLYNIEKNRELNSIKEKNSRKYLIFGSLLILFSLFGLFLLKRKNNKKETLNLQKKNPGKKIVISDNEIDKIETAITKFKNQQLFLKSNITRKSFCADNAIKSERYLSQYINEKYKKSFSVFINDLRLEYAYNKIKNDKMFRHYKIEEIAKACGFGSKKSFERVFLAKYNETPYKLILRLTS
ncbi:helix-turn-helix domain-containing protein [Olleya sp. R77988]|uniref:helix-turn-helix domain-containing protein n=1 Tax=Olleya sp. R77988 TaxID=3093875 RepID=UPI0037C52AD0